MAASTTAKVVIKGENQLTKAAKSAAGDLSALSAAVSKAGSAIKGALTLTAVTKGLKELGAAAARCMDEFGAADRRYRQLALAVGDTEAYESVTESIRRLSRETLSGKDEVEAMAAELAALGKDADEIEKTSEAAVALSNVTGKDLSSSMTALLQTYTGSVTQLKRLGVSLEGVTKEELEQGAAVEEVIARFGEYSKALADGSTRQHLKNISDTWGDVRQQIGGILDYLLGDLIAGLDAAFSGMAADAASVMDYLGACLANLPEVMSATAALMGSMLATAFSWESLGAVFRNLFGNIVLLAGSAISLIADSIPRALTQVLATVINWIQYIGDMLAATLLEALEGCVNSLGGWLNANHGTLAGIFGIGDKLSNADFGAADALRAAAGRNKEEAGASAAAILGPLMEGLSGLGSALTGAAGSTSSTLAGLFGEDIAAWREAVDGIVASDLGLVSAAADVTRQEALLGDAAEAAAGSAEEAGSWLLGALEDGIASLSESISGIGGVIGASTSLFSGASGSVLSSVSGIISTVMGVVNPFAALMTVAEGLLSVLEPAIDAVIAPINDALTWIGETLGSLFLPVLDQLGVVTTLIGSVLETVMAPVIESLTPLFSLLSQSLEVLQPLLVLVAEAFVVLSAPVQWVADLLSWLGEWITWMGSCISTFIYNLTHLKNKSYSSSPGSFSSDAFSGLSERLAAVSSLASSSSSLASDSTSSSTSVSSASYQGATEVTINIYQQSPVVGTGGMAEFARMILAEFEELSYYGVTT